MNPYLELVRPSVCILAFFGILTGLLVVGVPSDYWLFPIAAAVIICASGNVINDYFDIEIDKVNKPGRALPSGRVPVERAQLFYVLLATSGLIISSFVSINFFVLAIINILIAFYYAYKLKRTLGGNFFDTYLASSLFVAPVLISSNFTGIFYSPAFIVALIPFFANYGREILKDVEDMEGDKRVHAKTVPLVFGKKKAILLGKIMIFIGSSLLFLPWLFKIFPEVYFIFAVFLFGFTLAVLRVGDIEKIQKIVKVIMFLVILSFIVSIIL